MPTIPGTENLSPAVKYVIAFAIIFLLLALFALILRRLTGGKMALTSERGRARQPRLGIVDVYDLDRQRQLILLRRDNVEHLLLVGGPNDVVVETNIVRVPGARLPAAQQLADAIEKPEPPPARNVEIPPARPALESAAARAVPAEPVIASTLGTSEALATVAGSPEPVGALEPMLKPTRVEPAPAQPAASPPSRPATLKPVSNRPASPNGNGSRPPEIPPAPPPPRQELPRQELPRQELPRQELPRQEAPRQPPSPVRMVEPAPPPRLETPPPPPAPPPRQEASSRPEPAPPSPRLEPVPPPSPPPRQEPPPPAPPPPPPPKPDPFSIEDIEAEFARLLGRPLDKK